MTDLDDPEVYRKLDPSRLRERLQGFPQQCLRAWQRSLDFPLPADYREVSRILVLGMGGSAIGGDFLASLLDQEGGVPVGVLRDYTLPASVDAQTLVIASSYSGMTEETLSSFSQALATPAKKVALTTGGKLKELAEERGLPVFLIDYPAEPRAALAYSFIPLVGFCQKLGLVSDKSREVGEMVALLGGLLGEIGEGAPLSRNPAKRLARKIFGRLAVIYAAGHLSEVARRWKTQLNENSKAWAFYETLPELDHNAVVGYQFPRGMGVFVVFLRSPSLHRRTLARYEATAQVLAEAGIDYEVVEARGGSPLSQIMSASLFGDWVSYYLALLNGIDPSPTEVIARLKQRLSEF